MSLPRGVCCYWVELGGELVIQIIWVEWGVNENPLCTLQISSDGSQHCGYMCFVLGMVHVFVFIHIATFP